MRRERVLRLDLPHIQGTERKSARGGQLEHADMLACYNQSVLKDIAITITTRIDHCNHYWAVEKVKYERGNDDSGKREEA